MQTLLFNGANYETLLFSVWFDCCAAVTLFCSGFLVWSCFTSSWADPDLARLGLGKPWDCPQGDGKYYRACSHCDLTLDQWKTVDRCVLILAYRELMNYSVFWEEQKHILKFGCLYLKEILSFQELKYSRWSYIICNQHNHSYFAVHFILQRDDKITINIMYRNMLTYICIPSHLHINQGMSAWVLTSK